LFGSHYTVAHGFFEDLYTVIAVVDGLGDAVAAVGRRQVFGQGAQAIQLVVDVVGDGDRGGRSRTGGVGRGGARTPGFQQFAARGVAAAGHQPLGTDLRGAADQTAVGVGARAVDLGQVGGEGVQPVE